ncbi:MAG TPA: hypothetical protein VHS81_10505 [Caulobacteraceae bacterium]|jgi:hypothetical protein|nr:hypothetical protein [Caulobacteraceae bacterium]
MDFLRRMTGRPRSGWRVLAAATALSAAAGFGAVCHAQDDRGAVSQSGYQGPYLSWAGKQPAEAPPPSELTEARYAPAPDYAPGRYVPQSPRGDDAPPPNDAPPPSRYMPASYAPAPQSAPAPTAPSRAAVFAPPAPAPAPPTEAAPAPAAAPSPPDEGASELFPPPEPAAAQAAPAPAASAAPPSAAHNAQPAAAQPAAQAAPSTAQGPSSVRFYSLHRAYGMSPDPIPAPTEGHTVLIGPPDHGAADQAQDQSQGGDADQDGDGRKSAAHGDAAGYGPSEDN